MPMQYTEIFTVTVVTIEKFQFIFCNIFFLSFAKNIDCGHTLEPPQRGGSNEYAQNIDCGHTLEPPQRGGSNEYPQSIF